MKTWKIVMMVIWSLNAVLSLTSLCERIGHSDPSLSQSGFAYFGDIFLVVISLALVYLNYREYRDL